MRILPSVEWLVRVARQISQTSFSAGTRVGGAEDFWLFLASPRDGTREVSRYANHQFGVIDPDAEKVVRRRSCDISMCSFVSSLD
jgi:hypothetical protein